MKLNTTKEVTCVAHLLAKKGQREALFEILKTLIKPSKSEPGCLSYQLHNNIENPDMFIFVDKFKDQQAFDYHCETPHVKEAFDNLIPPLVESMDITVSHEIRFDAE